MLKKLQRRFMLIAMLALASLLTVQLVAVNVANIYLRDKELCNILETIADNNGSLPSEYMSGPFDIEDFFNPFGTLRPYINDNYYSTRYFVVEITENRVSRVLTDHIDGVTDKMAYEYASQVYRTQKPGFGLLGVYRYYYTVEGDKQLMVFVDAQKDFDAAATIMSISVIVGILTLMGILLPVKLFCKMAVRPVANAIDKQKQFITDAGHELKTPLAIISADAEVIELCEGESEWLTSIKNQTQRMSVLIKNLVNLSKLDELSDGMKREHFNLSETVTETVASFETKAKYEGKNLTVNVVDNLMYYGCHEEIIQLISILCDNAIKYSAPCGVIVIILYKSGKNVCLDCYNTCEHIDPETASKLFDRFYRADASRSRETGGYGIGLSIAKAIVERHKGKIRAVTSGTTEITFKITF